jgi:hypothetical protein
MARLGRANAMVAHSAERSEVDPIFAGFKAARCPARKWKRASVRRRKWATRYKVGQRFQPAWAKEKSERARKKARRGNPGSFTTEKFRTKTKLSWIDSSVLSAEPALSSPVMRTIVARPGPGGYRHYSFRGAARFRFNLAADH